MALGEHREGGLTLPWLLPGVDSNVSALELGPEALPGSMVAPL